MQTEKRHQILIIAPDASMDGASAAQLDEQVRIAIEDGCRQVILDLDAARYLAAAALRAILDIAAMLDRLNGCLAVVGASEQAHALMQVSGVSHALLQFDTIADAEQHLQQLPRPQEDDADDDDAEDDDEYEDEDEEDHAFDDD
jgi:anti-anti-sigma factor